MIQVLGKMGFSGLLAAVLIGFCEQTPAEVDFDHIILTVDGVEAGVTLRWGLVGLATMLGQWIKRRTTDDDEMGPGGADPAAQ